MAKNKFPAEILAAVAKVTTKRGKLLVNHILEHGAVSSEELEEKYGLMDAASAARDVKDAGVPLISTRGKRKNGRQMAIYQFGDPSEIRMDRFHGRRSFSKGFKKSMIERCSENCALCSMKYEPRYLQIDHRIPYQIVGETIGSERDIADYMLLCRSCQRSKSWACEQCNNWREGRLSRICQTCYWARPEDYSHMALKDHRRLEIVWIGADEVMCHTRLKALADGNAMALPVYAKSALAEHVRRQRKK